MAGMERVCAVSGLRNKATLIRTRKKKVVVGGREGEREGRRKKKKKRGEQQKGWWEWCVFQQSMAVEARR